MNKFELWNKLSLFLHALFQDSKNLWTAYVLIKIEDIVLFFCAGEVRS